MLNVTLNAEAFTNSHIAQSHPWQEYATVANFKKITL